MTVRAERLCCCRRGWQHDDLLGLHDICILEEVRQCDTEYESGPWALGMIATLY